ncbi:MAG: ZIP family metal transporter [Candidatus Cryptobacteroides sp.]|nr:ZIP family metal transporter [Bacteroidales bacterium]MDD6052811.1 ZIP family metal transporter [Bacteroidales bacterium]
MREIWLSAAGLCGSTLLGSAIGFFFKGMSHKWQDTVMGYCAGVMLAASVLGLLVPAMEFADGGRWWMILAGVCCGVLFLNLMDVVTPHLHSLTGVDPEEHGHNRNLDKTLLIVLAIAMHKLPEGMAAGVGFNMEDTADAWSVVLGISIQNIPEAMIVIAPLLVAGVSRLRAGIAALVISLLEIAGVWLGYALGAISQMVLPLMLAFVGGLMLYVVSDEMIPETHSHGYHKYATYALMLGFLTIALASC